MVVRNLSTSRSTIARLRKLRSPQSEESCCPVRKGSHQVICQFSARISYQALPKSRYPIQLKKMPLLLAGGFSLLRQEFPQRVKGGAAEYTPAIPIDQHAHTLLHLSLHCKYIGQVSLERRSSLSVGRFFALPMLGLNLNRQRSFRLHEVPISTTRNYLDFTTKAYLLQFFCPFIRWKYDMERCDSAGYC